MKFPEEDIKVLISHLRNRDSISNNKLADACYNTLGYCISVTDVSDSISATYDLGVMEDNEIANHLEAFNRYKMGLPPWLSTLILSILKHLLTNKHFMVFV